MTSHTDIEYEGGAGRLPQPTIVLGGAIGGDGEPGSLPTGGAPGQVLTKRTAADGDALWQAPRIPWASTNW